MWKRSLLLLLSAWCASGQIRYSIETLAGSNAVGDGGPATSAQLSDAQGVAVGRDGAVYIADPDNHRVRRVGPDGIIETVAGTGFAGFSGDGGPGSEARLNAPYGVAVDGAGNVYVADLGNNRVRRVSAEGTISTVASGLLSPRNVAVDAAGNLYISEFEGHRVLRALADGVLRTVAGNGNPGGQGDGAFATSAELAYPAGIAIDALGALYIADSGNGRIRRVVNGVIDTLPLEGFTLRLPTGVANDGANGVYIADSGNRRVLRRMSNGLVVMVAGSATFASARDVAVDGFGSLLVADGRRVRIFTGARESTVAGDGTFGFRGDGGAATAAVLNGPAGVAVGGDGSVYIADGRNGRVRRVSTGGTISTVLAALEGPEGLYADPGGVIWIGERIGARVQRLLPGGTMITVAGPGAQLIAPGQVAVDSAGSLYIADSGNNRIRKITPGGTVSTFAGTGVAGFGGDGGQALLAQFNQPHGVAFDAAGNLYIADTNNHRIRKVTPGGLTTTVAGDGELPLAFPRGVAVDLDRNLYICDTGNNRIVRISADGEWSVIAGTGGAGFSGDGGAALTAQLCSPSAIALDRDGNIYVADLDNNRIRKLTPLPPESTPAPITQSPRAVFLHAATLSEGPIAAGQILSIVGDGIGPLLSESGALGEDGALPTLVGETQVFFDGHAAPLFDVQPNQIRAQVPYEVAGQATTSVELPRTGERVTLAVSRAAPGIFTAAGGKGPALAANFDGSLNTADNPASPGSIVTFYVTGEGQTDPAGISGKPSVTPYPRPAEEVIVRVGGRPAELVFLGEAPGKVGILQIDAIIPTIVNAGAVTLSVAVGAADSQGGVTVFVR